MNVPDRAAVTARVTALLREVPDYPEPGVLFRDITTVLADGPAFADLVAVLAADAPGPVDLVAGMDYRLYWHTPRLTGIEEKNIVSVNMLCMPKERRTKVEGLQEIDPANWTCPVRL